MGARDACRGGRAGVCDVGDELGFCEGSESSAKGAGEGGIGVGAGEGFEGA